MTSDERKALPLPRSRKDLWLPMHAACSTGDLEIAIWMQQKYAFTFCEITPFTFTTVCSNKRVTVVEWMLATYGPIPRRTLVEGAQAALRSGSADVTGAIASRIMPPLSLREVADILMLQTLGAEGLISSLQWLKDTFGAKDASTGAPIVAAGVFCDAFDTVRWMFTFWDAIASSRDFIDRTLLAACSANKSRIASWLSRKFGFRAHTVQQGALCALRKGSNDILAWMDSTSYRYDKEFAIRGNKAPSDSPSAASPPDLYRKLLPELGESLLEKGPEIGQCGPDNVIEGKTEAQLLFPTQYCPPGTRYVSPHMRNRSHTAPFIPPGAAPKPSRPPILHTRVASYPFGANPSPDRSTNSTPPSYSLSNSSPPNASSPADMSSSKSWGPSSPCAPSLIPSPVGTSHTMWVISSNAAMPRASLPLRARAPTFVPSNALGGGDVQGVPYALLQRGR